MHGEIKPYLSETLLISMIYGYHSLFFESFSYFQHKRTLMIIEVGQRTMMTQMIHKCQVKQLKMSKKKIKE
jgi:hypothetical protein